MGGGLIRSWMLGILVGLIAPDDIGCARGEPTLSELLADPLVQMVMRSDKVSPPALAALLAQTRSGLKGKSPSA